jgi:hypothetical protein
LSKLVRHGKKGKGRTHSCRDKKICKEQERILYFKRLDIRIEARRVAQIDKDSAKINSKIINLKEGDYIAPTHNFLNDKIIDLRFNFSRTQIYRVTKGGIFDDNGKFLDLDLHEVCDWGTIKLIIPIRSFYYFNTHDYCCNQYGYREFTCDGSWKKIEEFYYGKSLHRKCKECYNFQQNEKKKTKNAMAFINTVRKAKK